MTTASTPGLSQDDSLELALPPPFEPIQVIKDMSNERLNQRAMVHVIGIVKDYQPPILTKGTDYKCTIEIQDLSTQFGQGIKVEIFYPREKMPPISGPGDVVLIRNIKAQIWKGCLSLLTNWSTVLNVFTATQIPLWPLLSSNDLAPAIATTTPYPSLAEANYIAWLHHHMDKSDIPNDEEFKQNMTRAMNVRDKYSLFKDLKCDHFYDLIGEVIRLYDSDGRISLYLSDYTPHSLFFNHAWGDTGDDGTGRDGDEYGYTKSRTKKAAEWPGPFGKMTLQLTVWDPHAAYIREQVKVGDWLLLRNVQSRMARMGGCLEGFLREDQKSYEGKIQVQILRQSTNPDENDSRWKDAVRRKQQWWAKFKEEKKNFLEEVTEEAHDKRNRDENEGSSKSNGKKRRKEKRAAAEVKVIAIEQKLLDKLDLNENIKCRNPSTPSTPLSEILSYRFNTIKSSDGADQLAPFVNAKYRSNVRVVDFWPHKLEDFALGRRVTEYDMLSDFSGGESTDNEGDMAKFREGKGFGGEKKWEWRFALQVEDVTKNNKERRERIWLMVNHENAQALLKLDDATNLRQDKETLNEIRESLFKLWGDLEEKKSAFLRTPIGKALLWASQTSARSVSPERSASSSPEPEEQMPIRVPRRSINDPPPDSDDENDALPVKGKFLPESAMSRHEELSDNNRNSINGVIVKSNGKVESKHLSMAQAKKELDKAIESLPVTNKGFSCCIQQYGVKVSEINDDLADAGEGVRWQRMYGLFGTIIT